MSTRVENVILRRINRGTQRANVSVPRGSQVVQLVVDRQPFEAAGEDTKVFWMRVFDGSNYLGGAEFTNRRIDELTSARPGQRMLWSIGRWPLPQGLTSITVEIEALRRFDCTLHVDFF